MNRADRMDLVKWIAGPHRGYRVELDPDRGRLHLRVRYRVRMREPHTGQRLEVYRGPWQWVGCEEILCMLVLAASYMRWRLVVAYRLRELRWHTRGRRS